MNPEAQAVLDEILKINPKDLNVDQRAFLRARRTYLKDSQLEEYQEVLEAEEVVEESAETGKVDYKELLTRAKELGYTGGRVQRSELEKFIANAEEEAKKQNPFN